MEAETSSPQNISVSQQPGGMEFVIVDVSVSATAAAAAATPSDDHHHHPRGTANTDTNTNIIERFISPVLTTSHAGYFRITLSLCSQALLWRKTTTTTLAAAEDHDDPHALRRLLPFAAFLLLWSLALLVLSSLSLLYLLRCFLHFDKVKAEFLHDVGVNYLFAPWISWLLLLQSSPFIPPTSPCYTLLWALLIVPILALDVKIYGQWFTKGRRFLAMVANPASQLSVIGNLVGAWAASHMGWKETAAFFFSLGIAHYLVLFVTLYQRLSGSSSLPVALRPVLFLFFAAPSAASLAWDSIIGSFDNSSKMLFFLSLFLFISLVSRPALFRKSIRKFNVAWWAYSFPLTFLALAATEYAQAVTGAAANALMLVLSALSVLVSLLLMLFTALNINIFFTGKDDPALTNSNDGSAT